MSGYKLGPGRHSERPEETAARKERRKGEPQIHREKERERKSKRRHNSDGGARKEGEGASYL